MDIKHIKTGFYTVVTVGGGFLAKILGGWSTDLQTLLILMALDFIMGLLIAAVWKKSAKSKNGTLNSVSAWKGLCRKGIALCIVLVANRLDLTLGVNYIRTAVIVAFIVNELISIVENAGIMGVPIPAALNKAIEVLKDKEESKPTDATSEPVVAAEQATAEPKSEAATPEPPEDTAKPAQ